MAPKKSYAEVLLKLLCIIEKLPKTSQACLIGLSLVTGLTAVWMTGYWYLFLHLA